MTCQNRGPSPARRFEMMTRARARGRMLSVLLGLALVATACGNGGNTAEEKVIVGGADPTGQFIDSGTEDKCEPTDQVTRELNDATYAIVLRWVTGQDADGNLEYTDALIGTGWAVDERRIVTNAHVAEIPFQYPEAQLVAVQAGTGEVVNLLTAYIHPDYRELEGFTPDVGVFTTQQRLPVSLPLAPADTPDLKVRSRLLLTGFPGDVDTSYPITVGETKPQPTALTGTVTALRTYDDSEVVSPGNADTVQHDISTVAGNSGSALVMCGQVVGIHAAGLYVSVYSPGDQGVQIEQVPSSDNRFGHHVKYIHELLDLIDSDVIVGATIAGEGVGQPECPESGTMLAQVNSATYAVVIEVPGRDGNGQPTSSFFAFGTAFAVGERLLATNAHITSFFDGPPMPISKVYAVQSGTGAVFELTRAFTHPDYTGLPLASPDVGLLTTVKPLPSVLPLADPNLVDISLGEDVFVVGFPGDVNEFIPVVPGQTIPQATALSGAVTALRAYNPATQVKPDNVDVIQHQAPTTPGTSGSPMVVCGQVVGVNNAGTVKLVLKVDPETGDVGVDRIPAASNGFGVHVRWLEELLRLFDAQSLSGTELPPEVQVPAGGGQQQGDQSGAGAEPAVEFRNCPTQVPAGSEVFCDIVSANVVSGSWILPGFTDGPVNLETVNGTNTIQLNPSSGVIGQSFVITATVRGAEGSEVTATHTFTVVG